MLRLDVARAMRRLAFVALACGALACGACVGEPTRDAPADVVAPPSAVEPSHAAASAQVPETTPAPVVEAPATPRKPTLARASRATAVRVVVRLRTWADEPIVGASVAACGQAADGVHWPWWTTAPDGREGLAETVARATTDAKGEATFDDAYPGVWSFVADAAGFATTGRVVRIATGAPVDTTIHLEPASTLEGRVLDAAGAPAVGATVILGIWNSFDPWRPFRAVTDADGRFAFDDVASGDHGLFVGPRGAPTFRMCRVSVPDVKRIDVRLPRPSVARGVVVDDETGSPIEGALVEMAASASVTDANGRYEITAVAPLSEWRFVSAFKDGYAEAREMGGIDASVFDRGLAKS